MVRVAGSAFQISIEIGGMTICDRAGNLWVGETGARGTVNHGEQ